MGENKIILFLRIHKKVVRTVAVILVILLIFLFFFMRMSERKRQQNTPTDTGKQMTGIQKMDLSTSVSLTGTIASGDNRSISADVSGVKVTKVNVAVGDYVNAGDTIITLDSSSLEEELAAAKEDYELAVTKSNKTVKDAKDNVTDASKEYTEGIADQQSYVADALSDYNTASAKETEKKEAYEKTVKETEEKKEAYEEIKAQKSSLKKKLEKAQKASQEANEELKKAEGEYEKAQNVSKDQNGNIDEAVYQAYMTAKSAAEEAQAAYQKAQTDYDRIEEAGTAYQEAKKAEEAALEEYENAKGNTSDKYKEYEKSLETQEETNSKNAKQVEESEYNYTITSKESDNNLKNQKTQVQNAEEKLGECVVTSPISGVITSIAVEEGDTYEKGELFVVQDMSAFIVEASVDEYEISDIAKDMKAVVKTDATGEEELAGVVTYVAPTPESSQGQDSAEGNSSGSASYKIQISLTDTNDRLRVGMTAKTSVILSSAEDVLAVPYDYVQTAEDGSFYIEVADAADGGKTSPENIDTRRIIVTKGMESDYYVEISSDEIYEGMMAVSSLSSAETDGEKDAAGEEDFESMMPGGMPGNMDTGNRGGGNRGGGAPGGGGRGGF